MAVQLDVGRRGPHQSRWRNQPSPSASWLPRRRRRRCRPRAPARNSCCAGACGPPAVLDQPLLAHRRDRETADPARPPVARRPRPGPARACSNVLASSIAAPAASGGELGRASCLRERHQHLAALRHPRGRGPPRAPAAPPRSRRPRGPGAPPRRSCRRRCSSGPESAICSPVAGPSDTASRRSDRGGAGEEGEQRDQHRRQALAARSRRFAASPAAASRLRPASRAEMRSARIVRPRRSGWASSLRDQQLHRALELWARGGVGQLELDRDLLMGLAGAQRPVASARELQRPQPEPAEAVGDRVARQRPQAGPASRSRAARARWAGPRRRGRHPRAPRARGARAAARPAAAPGTCGRRRRGRSGGARAGRPSSRGVGAEAHRGRRQVQRHRRPHGGSARARRRCRPRAGAARRPRRRPRRAARTRPRRRSPTRSRAASAPRRARRARGRAGPAPARGSARAPRPRRMPERDPEAPRRGPRPRRSAAPRPAPGRGPPGCRISSPRCSPSAVSKPESGG